MGDVIQGPWKPAPQSVPSTEPSDVDRLIIQEINNLCHAFMQLEQRVARLEGGTCQS